MIQRGEIRWFRFSAPDKRRPVLILGQDDILPSLHQIPFIPLTTQTRGLPWEVALTVNDGLPNACVLKPEWIRSIPREELGPWIASFPAHRWQEVRTALLTVLGFQA